MNPSPHIEKLIAEGRNLEILEDKFIIVRNVPYLNKNLELRYGSIVSTLEMNGDDLKPFPDHPISFIGEQPCKINGEKFKPNNANKLELFPGLWVDFYYSYKKNNQPYADYYEKLSHYFRMFSKHAFEMDPTILIDLGSLTKVTGDSPFQYSDCNSASPEVNVLLEKFKDLKIGIIGLGGTGSYILDYISKTPVKEVHIFDGDYYHNKNAFRSPGAISIDSLKRIPQKTEYYKQDYSKIHNGIFSHPDNIRVDNLEELNNLSFVFLSIDKSTIKRIIVDHLERNGIGFIDVGMGVNVSDGALLGQIRTTTSTNEKREHVHANKRIKFSENPENDYSKVPQIAELNALNAALAVIKWKKLVGFYHDSNQEYHSLYRLQDNRILNFENENRT